jgi:acyl-CoA synthetase (AMP-forming)/AMP-acid ligase II
MPSEVIDAGDDLPLTIPELLRTRTLERQDSPLLVCDDDMLTYAEADRRSQSLAKGLLAAGVRSGSHVGLLHPNGSAFVVAWLAATRLGAVAMPFSTFSTADELRTLLVGADVEHLLSASSFRSHRFAVTLQKGVEGLKLDQPSPLRSEATPALRHLWFTDPDPSHHRDWSYAELIASGAGVSDDFVTTVEKAVSPADRMVIVHTSGSTSAPKGVIHTHGSLIRHIDNLNQIRNLSSEDVLFANSPFFWIGGFAYALLGALIAGGCLVCSNAIDPGDVLGLIERERPTMVNGFAQGVVGLAADPSFADRDLSSIRRGNLYPIMPADVRPKDPELRHAMLGMTEAGSVCLLSEDESDQPERRRGSFGRPAPGFDTLVVNPDSGDICAIGEIGELYLRGPFMMEGYYGREQHETFDIDGWYHTGDLVAVDNDGFMYFRGRRGEMIKTTGANVSPREVELAIAHQFGVLSLVVGIDDPVRGQVVAVVLIEPVPGHVDPEVVRTQLAATLSAYKVPRLIRALTEDQIPVLSSGKPDMQAVKAMFDGD